MGNSERFAWTATVLLSIFLAVLILYVLPNTQRRLSVYEMQIEAGSNSKKHDLPKITTQPTAHVIMPNSAIAKAKELYRGFSERKRVERELEISSTFDLSKEEYEVFLRRVLINPSLFDAIRDVKELNTYFFVGNSFLVDKNGWYILVKHNASDQEIIDFLLGAQ